MKALGSSKKIEFLVNYFRNCDAFTSKSLVNIEGDVDFEGGSVIFVNDSVGLLEIVELSVNYFRNRE